MTPRPKKRRSRPYDSARTVPRSTGQRSVSRPSGYQEQELTFETRRAPSQNTTRSRAYDFESQRPQQGTFRPRTYDFESQRPQQGTSRPRAYDFEGQRPHQGTSRPRQDNSIQFPTQQVRRPAGGSSQNKTVHTGQRLRPAQNQPQRRKHRRMTRAEMRRRRLARRLTAFGLLLCVIGAGVYLTVTMLFKINTIQLQLADTTLVEQAGGYSSQEILAALGVASGENIFSFDPDAKAQALEQQFPLLEQIRVVRDYPNTVAVRVVEAVPTWAMETSKGWLTLSARMKILECSGDQPQLPTLYGGEPVSTAPGTQVEYTAPVPEAPESSAESSAAEPAPDGRLEALDTLTTSLAQHGLMEGVTRIEFADTEQLAFLYQGRISVLLGTLNELEYKLDFAAYLLHNTDGKGCAETDTGQLDCSHVRGDGTIRPILAQGEPVLPSGYVAPPPAAPEPALETVPAEGEPAPDAAPADPAEAPTPEAPAAEPTAEAAAPAAPPA